MLQALKKIKEKPQRLIFIEKLADVQFLAKEYHKSYLNYQEILGKKKSNVRIKMAKVAFHQKLYLTVKKHIKILEKDTLGKKFPAQAFYYRGIMHAHDGNFTRAIEDLTKAESFDIAQKQWRNIG